MSNLKAKLNKIENKLGLPEERNYLFIQIMHPERFISDNQMKLTGGIYCSKGDFKGMVVISGSVNSVEEKRKILLKHGYKIINK